MEVFSIPADFRTPKISRQVYSTEVKLWEMSVSNCVHLKSVTFVLLNDLFLGIKG